MAHYFFRKCLHLRLCVNWTSRPSLSLCNSGCLSSDVLLCTFWFLYLSAEPTGGARLTFAEPLFQSGAAAQEATRSQTYKFCLCPTELISEWQKGWLRKRKERILYGEGQGLQRQEHWTLKSLQRRERNEEIISPRYQTEAPIYDDLLYSNSKSCPGE